MNEVYHSSFSVVKFYFQVLLCVFLFLFRGVARIFLLVALATLYLRRILFIGVGSFPFLINFPIQLFIPINPLFYSKLRVRTPELFLPCFWFSHGGM